MRLKSSSRKLNGDLIHAANRLRTAIDQLKFASPVAFVYNPLNYAWQPHRNYLHKFGSAPKRVIFLGMNPGPFGMAQTGVPFGQIAAVRDWMKIQGRVGRPLEEHPLRPVAGFACTRSEVSGQRLWNLFAMRFQYAESFFEEHIVLNYCPLAFLETTGRNRTPDKLPAAEKEALFAICDEHLRAAVKALQPQWLIGIGGFAAERAKAVLENSSVKLGKILHPSPANPSANQNWSRIVSKELEDLRVWIPQP